MIFFAQRVLRAVIDLLVVAGALLLAVLFRFEFAPSDVHLRRALMALPCHTVALFIAFRLAGFSRSSWRYVGLREALRASVAVGGVTCLWAVTRAFYDLGWLARGSAFVWAMPWSIILMQAPLTLAGILGVRVLRRTLSERAERAQHPGGSNMAPVVVVGAGRAGLLVVKELLGRPDMGMKPVGFVDDDPAKHGSEVQGVRVLGTTEDLPDIAEKTGAKQAIIAIANVEGAVLRRLLAACERAKLLPKVVPGLFEMVGGKVSLSNVRAVNIEDLLRRAPVTLEWDAIDELVRGKRVMVTGAGGSIGSEIARQVLRLCPQSLVLIERSEPSLFLIHRELSLASDAKALKERAIANDDAAMRELVPAMADVCDEGRMRVLFDRHRPQLVFHAAAHKHVPMMEWNPGEAVKNNVFGTRVVAALADAFEVERFVQISTDKAVNPTSVMGTTKRVAELQLQALAARSRTVFAAVRFGNVLGSAGSVIPVFQEQILAGGPVCVTHPDMRRYFMTIPEACQLVLQTSVMAAGGEIFILDMGEPVKIVDLARDLILLSGLRPDEDIRIEFTGLRPGEKLFEELATDEERAQKTRHPKIFIGKLANTDATWVEAGIERIRSLCDRGSEQEIYDALAALVPEATLRLGRASKLPPRSERGLDERDESNRSHNRDIERRSRADA